MEDFDISKLQGLKLDTSFRLAQSAFDDMERRNAEIARSIEESREEREAEELRRHNELLAALKEPGEKGATIVVGDNAKGVQILNNSAGATQTMTVSERLDYEQVGFILNEIKEYFDFPQFEKTFGDNSENVKAVVEATIAAVENREDEGFIKKSLRVLRDLAVGAAGSLIASGILAYLGTLPIG